MKNTKKLSVVIAVVLMVASCNNHSMEEEQLSNLNKNVAFLFAASENNLSMVKKLLDDGADIDIADADGNTALMLAAEENHCSIITILLNRGVDINKTDLLGLTALMAAIIYGNIDAVECLVSNPRIKIDQQDQHGNSALMIAVNQNNLPIIQKLLAHGANINLADFEVITPLMFAATNGYVDVVQYLATYPTITINQQSKKGNTGLMVALYSSNNLMIKRQLIQQLLAAGADPEIANKSGTTPLKLAQAIGDAEILSLINKAILKKHGVLNPFIKTQK